MEFWIVVVDDEALSLTNAKNMLSEENMRVSCLKSGRDLLKFMEKNNPDLILLDILMPEMDGFETFSRLRQFEEETGRAHVPVMFLTGENDSKTEREGLALGAADYIHKPFNREILVKRIENTIRNNKAIESLAEEAMVDRLTGFLNKARGTERISKLCSRKSGALIIIDLDSFKLVNDLFGHDAGDKVLQAFADIVRANIRETDTVCRIGGDEFIAFLEDLKEIHVLSQLTQRLNAQLAECAADLLGEEHGIPLGCSLGAVFVPDEGVEYDALFSYADSALYQVKQNGKHGLHVYEAKDGVDSSGFYDPEAEIDRVCKIIEERNESRGALVVGSETFSSIYHFMHRFYKRYGGYVVRILFSIEIENAGETDLKKAMKALEDLLRRSFRRSDIMMQNRSNQYFLMLNELTDFDAEPVIKRVLSAWENTGHAKYAKLSYSYRPELFEKEKRV